MATRTSSKSTEDTATAETSAEADARAQSGAPFTDKTVTAAHEALDRLSERVSRAEERLRSAASEGQEQWSDRQEQLRSQVDESMSGARDYVRENPLAAAGIAFAAGLLVANLLRR